MSLPASIAVGCALALLAAPVLTVRADEPAPQAQPAAPASAGMPDQVLVLARTVHPRIAYRGPAPDENPVRVQVTVFPGDAMTDSLGAIGGSLLGDGELAGTAPMVPLQQLTGPGGPLMGLGAAFSGTGGSATPIGTAANSVGGSVLRATNGLGSTITRAVMAATGAGGGP